MKDEIEDVIKRLRAASELVEQKNGQTLNLVKERIFTGKPFLHQATKNMSEEESAEFERKSPEIFNFLRSFDDQIRGLF